MKTVKKDEREFYEILLDTQIFEQFTQNLLTNNCYYFNKKVEIYNNKEKSKEKVLISANHFVLDKNYIIKPSFLKLDDDSLNDKSQRNLRTNEDGIILQSERIATNINDISNEKYDKSKTFIYILPEKSMI